MEHPEIVEGVPAYGREWDWMGLRFLPTQAIPQFHECTRLVAGITHPPPLSSYDDYDYGEVNQLLERNLKIYIKTVACYPEKTTKQIYTQFWRHFKHSEKVLPHPFPS